MKSASSNMRQHHGKPNRLSGLQVVISVAIVSSLCLCQSAANGQFQATRTNWASIEDSWNYWWSYSGVSGPAYWGLLNLDWFMCDKGRHQSPINIETKRLVYDPNLTPIQVDNNLISGTLYNDGHSVVFSAIRHGGVQSNLQNGQEQINKEPVSVNIDQQQQQQQQQNHSLKQLNKRQSTSEKTDSVFSLGETRLLDKSFLVVDRAPEDSIVELDDLSRSIAVSIGQSNQLDHSAGAILENDLVENKLQGDDDEQSESSPGSNQIDQLLAGPEEHQSGAKVLISGAGLPYVYQFEALYLKFGTNSQAGSEHEINSKKYPAELQLFAYNSHLYKSYTEASTKPNGLLAIGILLELWNKTESNQNRDKTGEPNQRVAASSLSSSSNEQLDKLLKHLDGIGHRGAAAHVQGLNVSALMPMTDQYVTYDGSLTQPGCHESVNWIILNKPLYITEQNLNKLRSLSADEPATAPTGTFLAGNIRPTQPINGRPIRTNIRPNGGRTESQETCSRLWTRYNYSNKI